ncbi:putative short-chain dehydrogenase/reductase [Kineosporia sp. NBRC 101731]|nr:putative short-chain dehydrogenase/reductase [Kineosporia sp. NBRC 101731]
MLSVSTFSVPSQHGRTVVVTGASSGIGQAAARALDAAGAHVVLAVRSPEKGHRAAASMPGSTEVRVLDLSELASVRAFAAGFDRPVDLLVNNAGIMMPPLRRTPDGFESQLGTNHLGHFALTNLLLPQITGRVVTVSSNGHRAGSIDFDDLNWERRPYRPFPAYAQSKLANLLFTAELQRRLTAAGSPVIATAAHPGLAATNLGHSFSDRAGLSLLARVSNRLAQSEDGGALPTLFAAVADVPGNAYAGPTGFLRSRGEPGLITPSKAARDADVARRLWTVSEELTGVRFPSL